LERDTNLLQLKNISVRFGDINAISDISLSVPREAITSLVGGNGAGKSTILNAISGFVPLIDGSIYFENERIDKKPSHLLVELGIIQIPEGRQIFPFMTVKENLEMGSMSRRSREKRKENLEKVMDIFPVLSERAHQIGKTLSGGEQQMLAIGRGLMGNPKMLMFDEPSLGLAPALVKEIFRVILNINDMGITGLLVEQDVKASLEASTWGYVLENGRMVLSGKSEDILKDDTVRRIYLGL
jgi:branched-chain amino acid transport system ATP-binding protein